MSYNYFLLCCLYNYSVTMSQYNLQNTPNLISGMREGPFRAVSAYKAIQQTPNYEFNAQRTGMTADSLSQLRSKLHPTDSLQTVPNLISGMEGPFSPAYIYEDINQLGNYDLTAYRSGMAARDPNPYGVGSGYDYVSGLQGSRPAHPAYALMVPTQGAYLGVSGMKAENTSFLDRLNLQTTPNLISGARFQRAAIYQDVNQSGNYLVGRRGFDPNPYGAGSGYDYVSGMHGKGPDPYGEGSGYNLTSGMHSRDPNPYGVGSGYDYVSGMVSRAAGLVGQFDISGQLNLPVDNQAVKNARSRLEGLSNGVRRATQLPAVLNELSINLPKMGGLKKK